MGPGPQSPPRASCVGRAQRRGPRCKKLVWPLPRAAPAPGPPPRGIGGPRPRPALLGRREAFRGLAAGTRRAWLTSSRPRVLGVASGPHTSAPRSPPARPAWRPSPGWSCGRRETPGPPGRASAPDGQRSLLSRLVLTFF